MTPARRAAALIVLSVAALTLALVVFIRHRTVDSQLLAAGLLVGGLAIVVVALPENGRGDPP